MGIFEGADNGGLLTPEPVSVRKRQAFWLALTLAALVWAFLTWTVALAQVGQPNNCSGSVGATAALVSFPASGATGPSAPSLYVTIVNAHATQGLWVNALPGGTAAAGASGSIPIGAGGSVSWWRPAYGPPGRISIIGSGADTTYTCGYQ